MNVRDVLEFLRKYWIGIMVFAALGALVGGLMVLREKPTYSAASGIFLTVKASDPAAATNGASIAASQTRAFASVAKSQIVLQSVIEELDLDMTMIELAGYITAAIPADGIVVIDVKYVDAQGAADIANAVIERLADVVPQLSPTGADGKPTVQPTIITRAAVPSAPSGPSRTQDIGIGLIAGMAAGLAQAAFRRSLKLSAPRAEGSPETEST